MRSTISKLLGGIFLTAAIAGAPSCAETDSAIFVRQVQLAVADDNCIVTNDPGALPISRGVLDVSLSTAGYTATLLVGNQLVPRGDNDRLLPETSRVHLYEAEVTLFDFGGTQLAAYTQPITGFVDPTSNTSPGYGLTSLAIIDPSAVASLPNNQTIVARIKVFGRTLGGIEVESGYWDYPIDVCSGCLANRCVPPAACDDDCVQVCAFGQDLAPDCRATSMNPCTAPGDTVCAG